MCVRPAVHLPEAGKFSSETKILPSDWSTGLTGKISAIKWTLGRSGLSTWKYQFSFKCSLSAAANP